MWLAIDTSGCDASLAWFDPHAEPGSAPLWQRRVSAGRSHNTRLFGPLAEAMGLDMATGLTAIVVGTGPGSYTGIRIGIACALGIALQREQVHIYPWPSCTAMQPGADENAAAVDPLSHHDPTRDYLLLGDARRGRFSLCQVRDGRLVEPPRLLDRRPLVEGWLHGRDSLPLWTNDPDPAALGAALGLAPGALTPVRADAHQLALRVAALDEAERQSLTIEPPAPIYLAAPFVTRPKAR